MQDMQVDDLYIGYGGQTVVHGVSFTVASGEVFGLVGPSGSGKSSILRAVGGYLAPAGGTISIGGLDVTRRSPGERDFGMVFQGYALFEHMTVRQNIAFGLKARRLDRAEVAARVEEVVELTSLGSLVDRHPRQLSGGQQQRVALARALAIRPRVLLMDEPLGALDVQLRESLLVGIKQIQSTLGITTLYVTHDQNEAFTICDRMAVLKDGKLAALGPPEHLYERPPTSFTATFIGHGNLFRLDVDRLRAGGAVAGLPGQVVPLQLAEPLAEDTHNAFVFVRPEALRCAHAAPAGSAKGTVVWRRYRGGDALVGVEVPDHAGTVIALVGDRSISERDEVGIWWEPGHATVIEETDAGVGTRADGQRLVPGDGAGPITIAAGSTRVMS